MKRTITAVVAGAMLAGTGILTAAVPASADTRPCISRTEFRAIKTGMSLTRVAGIVGSRGKVSMTSSVGGYTLTIRSWHNCGQFSAFTSNATFTNGRVSGKTSLF